MKGMRNFSFVVCFFEGHGSESLYQSPLSETRNKCNGVGAIPFATVSRERVLTNVQCSI